MCEMGRNAETAILPESRTRRGRKSAIVRSLAALVYAIPVVVLFAAFGASGCSKKAGECNRFISAINNNSDAIKAATDRVASARENPSVYEEFATTVEAAADAIKKVETKNEELQKLALEYDEFLRHAAKSSREVGQAIIDRNKPGVVKAQGEISKIGPREAALVEKINNYCAE